MLFKTIDLRSNKTTEYDVPIENLLELMRVVRSKNKLGVTPTSKTCYSCMKTKKAGTVSPQMEEWANAWKGYIVSSMEMSDECLFKMKPSPKKGKLINRNVIPLP